MKVFCLSIQLSSLQCASLRSLRCGLVCAENRLRSQRSGWADLIGWVRVYRSFYRSLLSHSKSGELTILKQQSDSVDWAWLHWHVKTFQFQFNFHWHCRPHVQWVFWLQLLTIFFTTLHRPTNDFECFFLLSRKIIYSTVACCINQNYGNKLLLPFSTISKKFSASHELPQTSIIYFKRLLN